jgi:cysteine desulfurase
MAPATLTAPKCRASTSGGVSFPEPWRRAVLTYLDHAATVPLRPEVAAAMAEVHAELLGNPTGSHPPAQRARRLLEEARDEVAAFLGRDPGQVVFTSGGTESANLAVLGTVDAALRERGEAVVLSSAVEHPAVRESCRAAARLGADARELPVDRAGVLDLDALARTLSSRVALVAIMAANNETGVVQPVADVVAAVRRRAAHAAVFTDAVQAAPFLDLAGVTAGADLVSLSAHKVGGPVGVGALAVHPDLALSSRQHGGGQERERRSGTQDVAGAVGLATALGLTAAERAATAERVAAQRDRLAAGLLDALPDAHRTVPVGVAVLPGHLHLCLPGLEREELLVALGAEAVCVSGGSSCASGALEPSHVLAAMGLSADLAQGALRFSLGSGTTDADVERALSVVPAAVASLRIRA